MSLSDNQYLVLVLWWLRSQVSETVWIREWNQDLRKKGRVDGNLRSGRWRTFHSLLKDGFLSAPPMRGSIHPNLERSVFTDRGLEALSKVPDRVSKRFSPLVQAEWKKRTA